MPFFPGQPSISMEIETSFLRGPLLTCSSHISAREPVPQLCSEQRGYIYPVSWQVVPKEPLHWILSPQNVKQRADLDSPSLAWMSPEAAFLLPGTNENLSNRLFLFLSSSYFFLSIFFSVCVKVLSSECCWEWSCQKWKRQGKIKCYSHRLQLKVYDACLPPRAHARNIAPCL